MMITSPKAHKDQSPAGFGVLLVSFLILMTAELQAGNHQGEPQDFTRLSFEELGAIEVTSVSKKTEKLNAAPAAVSVISNDDIRRSGAMTFPEALRLAPGVQVASIDARQWAVSTRGFNDAFAQKMLVLMDGRSVYTPLFSGTYWHTQDLMLEDVDRIEVIRGPGSTIWGANAVNGVVNIVSKPARETQGLLATGGAGTSHLVLGGLRYGGQLGDQTFFRLYGKYDDWENSALLGGQEANDGWEKNQGGFRLDWEPSTDDRFTLQGDLMSFHGNQRWPQIVLPVAGMPPPGTGYSYTQIRHLTMSNGNILGRWTHEFSPDSDISVQSYYEQTYLDIPLAVETRDTYDLDFQHRFQLGNYQEIVWGGGLRLSYSDLRDSVVVQFNDQISTHHIANGFIQDEITLVPDRLRLTLGSKIEHNNYTDFEFQPGGRLSWTPTAKQTIWLSVARAVRTPSQVEIDGRINLAVRNPYPPTNPFPTLISVIGNPDFESETLVAYELGYRIQAHQRLILEAAAFINDYDNLRSSDTTRDLSALPNYVEVESRINNAAYGQTYGGELAATWQTTNWWRWYGQFEVIQSDLHEPSNNLTGASRTPGISSPKYQLSFRSQMNLGRQVELDVGMRYIDSISAAGIAIPSWSGTNQSIPSYMELDIRLAWHPCERLELALVGLNLLDNHREFNPTYISSQVTEVTRSIYAKLTLRF